MVSYQKVLSLKPVLPAGCFRFDMRNAESRRQSQYFSFRIWCSGPILPNSALKMFLRIFNCNCLASIIRICKDNSCKRSSANHFRMLKNCCCSKLAVISGWDASCPFSYCWPSIFMCFSANQSKWKLIEPMELSSSRLSVYLWCIKWNWPLGHTKIAKFSEKTPPFKSPTYAFAGGT